MKKIITAVFAGQLFLNCLFPSMTVFAETMEELVEPVQTMETAIEEPALDTLADIVDLPSENSEADTETHEPVEETLSADIDDIEASETIEAPISEDSEASVPITQSSTDDVATNGTAPQALDDEVTNKFKITLMDNTGSIPLQELRAQESDASTPPTSPVVSEWEFGKQYVVRFQLSGIVKNTGDPWVYLDIPAGIKLYSDLETIKNQENSPIDNFYYDTNGGSYGDSSRELEYARSSTKYRPKEGRIALDISNLSETTNFNLLFEADPLLWNGVENSSITGGNIAFSAMASGRHLGEGGAQAAFSRVLDTVKVKYEEDVTRFGGAYQALNGNVTGISAQSNKDDKINMVSYRFGNQAPESLPIYGGHTISVYVPHKKIAENDYESAELDTASMDGWISKTKYAERYDTEVLPDGRIKVTFTLKPYIYERFDVPLYYKYPNPPFVVGDTVYYSSPTIAVNQSSGAEWTSLGKDNFYPEPTNDPEFSTGLDNSLGTTYIVGEKSPLIAPSYNGGYATYTDLNQYPDAITRLSNFYYKFTNNVSPIYTNVGLEIGTNTKNNTTMFYDIGATSVQFWSVRGKAQTIAGKKEEFITRKELQEAGDPNATNDKFVQSTSGVDSPEDKLNLKDYKYQMKFDLVKLDSGNNQETTFDGEFSFTPRELYGDDSKLFKLEGFNKNGIWPQFTYVNREMLINAYNEANPANQISGDDAQDTYIAGIDYNITMIEAYMSGYNNRWRESAGNIYGKMLNENMPYDTSVIHKLNLQEVSDPNNKIVSTTSFYTRRKKDNESSIAVDIPQENMSIKKVENGVVGNSVADQDVTTNDMVKVEASAEHHLYPYGDSTVAPNPVFLIRVPFGMDLNQDSIQVKQVLKADNNEHTISFKPLQELVLNEQRDEQTNTDVPGDKLYVVELIGSDGFQRYGEDSQYDTKPIKIEYTMSVNHQANTRAISYQELIFITDKNIPGNSDSPFEVIDSFGISEALVADNNKSGIVAPFKSSGTPYLTTTNNKNKFKIVKGKLKLQPHLTIKPDDDNDVIDGSVKINKENLELGISRKENIAQYHYTLTVPNGVKVGQEQFYFYIPIPKDGLLTDWRAGHAVGEMAYDLSLARKVTINSNTPAGIDEVKYKIAYTNEERTAANQNQLYYDNKKSNFDVVSVNSGISAEYLDEATYLARYGNFDKVTCIKIILDEPTDPNKTVNIYGGHHLDVTVPVKFSEDNVAPTGTNDENDDTIQNRLDDLAGKANTWGSYTVVKYDVGGGLESGETHVTPVGVRLFYKREIEKLELVASNNPNEVELKKYLMSLPHFHYQKDIRIVDVKTTDNLELKDKSYIQANRDSATEEQANKQVAVDAGLAHDLAKTLELVNKGSGDHLIGTTKDPADDSKLALNLDHLKKITTLNQERVVTVKMIGKNNKGVNEAGIDEPYQADDVYLTMKIKIRNIGKIVQQSAIEAGQLYQDFEDNTDVKISQKSSYSQKMTLNPGVGRTLKKANLNFGQKVPAGTVIHMKTGNEYYSYRITTPKNSVPMISFVAMDDDTKKYAFPEAQSEDMVFNFVVDYGATDDGAVLSNPDAFTTKLEPFTISDIAASDGTNQPIAALHEETGQYKVVPEREVDLQNLALDAHEYVTKDPITFTGDYLDSGVTGHDTYLPNGYVLSSGIRLYKKGAADPITLPRNATIEYDGKTYGKTSAEDVIIIPVDTLKANANTKKWQMVLNTPFEGLDSGEYELRIETYMSKLGSHPLDGILLENPTSSKAEFTVKDASTSGLRISSPTTPRLLYTEDGTRTLDLRLDFVNAQTTTIVLQKKNTTGIYQDVPDEVSTAIFGESLDVLKLTAADTASPVTKTIHINRIPDNITVGTGASAATVPALGQYRLLFKVTQADNAAIKYEVPYALLVYPKP